MVGWREGFREEHGEADVENALGSFQRYGETEAYACHSLILASQEGQGWSFKSCFQG